MTQNLESSLRFCKGVGEKREKLLNKLEIHTWKDLLFHFPRDYQDWRVLAHPPPLLAPQKTAFAGIIQSVHTRQARHRRLHITKAVLQRGHLYLPVIFFNQQYLSNSLIPGKSMVVYGKIESGRHGLEMKQVESWEILSSPELIEERAIIQPVYPLTTGITQNVMRHIIQNAFEKYSQYLTEYLSDKLLQHLKILQLKETVRRLHFPDSEEDIQKARHSMKIREALFPLLYWELKKRHAIDSPYNIQYIEDIQPVRDFILQLPFSLTGAQKKVLQELKDDLFASRPMRRLLQGDVGSGKTIVAFVSALFALYSGHKVCFMAPTEILALQHYKNIQNFIQQQGLQSRIRPVTLLGSLSSKEKKTIYGEIAADNYNFIIGTHALFQEKVTIPGLAYVIIDEQHRFGVAQRGQIVEKGNNPDVLIMTATPIPRTLTMTLYGDLKVSILDELPPGRQKVHTRIVDKENKNKLFNFCRSYLKEGGQIYIVCPLIEESEKLDLKAATKAYEEYKNLFQPYRCALLHGKLRAQEKQDVMQALSKNEIQILVSTTVIEVGVDIPNANIMIIEHPERFGLSQLHQLRGRIGRSIQKGYCFLNVPLKLPLDSLQRLEVLEKTSDGFEISQYDLELRGPGEFTGTRQHGFLDFQFLDLAKNLPLISTLRKILGRILAEDPDLNNKDNQLLKRELHEKYHSQLRYLEIK